MSTSAARAADTTASLGFSDLLSDDGTHLRAWTNDPEGVIDGPTVVLCNGLGTNPYVRFRVACRPEATLMTFVPAS